MSKRTFIVGYIAAALLSAVLIAMPAKEYTLIAQAEKLDDAGRSYVVTVKRWQDHERGGRYKRRSDRFRTDLLYRGKTLVSSYEFDGFMPTNKVIITWPKIEEFFVTLSSGVTVRCNWDERKAIWEQQ
jgi:hypothetical protein